MRRINDIYPYDLKPRATRGNNIAQIEEYLRNFWRQESTILSSARVGIYLALKFFNLRRWNHILVPDFLCQSILNILNTSSFPVKYPDSKTKAILLFHQWGYPQDMAKVLPEIKKRNYLIIVDCAHSFDSQYKNQPIGTFGDLAVFSFSKIFPTYIGGVLTSNNVDFLNYCKNFRQEKNNFYNKLFSTLAFKTAKKSFEEAKWRSILDLIYLKSINFPNISKQAIRLLPPNLDEFKKQLMARKENYLFLKNNIKAEYLIPDHDLNIDVNPLGVPIFLPLGKLEPARDKMRDRNIAADIMHFDINRNMFAPDYQKCLALPCHGQISQQLLQSMIDIINAI